MLTWDDLHRRAAGRPEWGFRPEPDLAELLDALPPARGRRALDLGCGDGRNTRLLAARHWRAHGLDVSPAALRRARRRRLPVPFTLGRADALPYADGRFALVLDVGLLHTIPPRRRGPVLDEIRRVLAPGGLYLALAFRTLGPAAEPVHRAAGAIPEWGLHERSVGRLLARRFRVRGRWVLAGGRERQGRLAVLAERT